jgi:hypothetical protein
MAVQPSSAPGRELVCQVQGVLLARMDSVYHPVSAVAAAATATATAAATAL